MDIKSDMRRSGVGFAIALAISLALGVAGTWLLYRMLASERAPQDATAGFLATHWTQPLRPQGEAPADYSPIEASLAPEACGTCHGQQYADWSTSLHSRSIGPGILWQFLVLSQEESNGCLRCHAPLAEQKALMALQYGWASAPTQPVPPYVSSDLHRRGLVCAACHVRRHRHFGPPSSPQSAQSAIPGSRLPHDGFVAEQAFLDSRFCSTCHQFPPKGRSLAGKLIENTFEEWRTSPAAAQGLTCQSCHMPDRRHLWRGIHDSEMVSRGLRRELEVTRGDAGRLIVRAIISTPGVGHFFPTYVVPKVTISIHLRSPVGSREIARRVIGRTVSVDLDREISDTRIPPGGNVVLAAEVDTPRGVDQVEFRVEVAPAEHYIRMFQSMLDRNSSMAPAAQTILREAIRQAQATGYRLDAVTVAVPGLLDGLRRSVAN